MSKKRKEKVVANLSEVSRRDLVKTLGPMAAVAISGCMGSGDGGDGSSGNGDGGDGGDGSSDGSDGGDSGPPTSSGGTLRAGLKVGVETMDGRSVTGLQSMQIMYNIYSRLLKYRMDGDELVLQGDLATDWEWEDDTTLTFELDEDAVFHNGEPVTASDVQHTVSSMYENPQYTASSIFSREVEVEVVDEHTASFNTGDEPFAALESNLGFVLGIINEQADQEQDMAQDPVGSGPFEFEEWVDGDHVHLSRFDDYWKEDEHGTQLPYLDGIEFNIYPEVQTKLSTLEQGSLDWIDLIPRKDVESVRNDDSLVTMESGAGAFMGIVQFNTTQPPFSDPNLRKAALHAINWEAIIDVAFNGVAIRGSNMPIPPQTGWEAQVEDPYNGVDLERAQELLDEAEVDPTVGFTNYVTRGDAIRIQMQELIQEMLNSELGINASIQIEDGSQVFERQSNNEFGFTVSGFNGMFDPDQVFSANLADGAFFNYGGYANEEIQTLLSDARGTLDEEERVQAYADIQQQYTDDAGKYYPYWDNAWYGMQPGVKNFSPLLDQSILFERVWKE